MPRPASALPPDGEPPGGLGGDPHGDARATRHRTRARSRARDSVAATLRAFREAAGFSQEQLGERAGLHRTYVGGYERAERRLTIEAVEQVLAALGVTWTTFGAAMDAAVRRRAAGRPAARPPRSAGRAHPPAPRG